MELNMRDYVGHTLVLRVSPQWTVGALRRAVRDRIHETSLPWHFHIAWKGKQLEGGEAFQDGEESAGGGDGRTLGELGLEDGDMVTMFSRGRGYKYSVRVEPLEEGHVSYGTSVGSSSDALTLSLVHHVVWQYRRVSAADVSVFLDRDAAQPVTGESTVIPTEDDRCTVYVRYSSGGGHSK